MSSMNRFSLLKSPEHPRGRATDPHAERHQKNAFRISLITAIVEFLAGGIGLAIVLSNGNRTFGAIFVVFVLAFAAAISAWLSRKGLYIRGILILGAGAILTELSMPFLVDQISIQVGLVLSLIIFSIAVYTLPNNYVAGIFIPTVIAAMAAILIDFYLPVQAAVIDTSIMTWFTVVFLALYGGLMLRQFRNFPLQGKLVISFVIVALVPLVVLAWMNLNRVTQLLESSTQQSLTRTAQQDADLVDNFLRTQLDNVRLEAQIYTFVHFASLSPQERSGSEAETEASSTLTTLSRKDPIYLISYALLDDMGWNLIDTVKENIGQQEYRQDYYLVPMETGMPYVSSVLFIDGTPSLYFSSPIRGANGKTIGILRLRYNASILQGILSASPHGSEGLYSILIDNKHYIRLAHSLDPFLLYKSYAPLSGSEVTQLQTQNKLPEGAPESFVASQPGIVAGVRNISAQPFFTTAAQANAPKGDAAISTAVHLKETSWVILARQSNQIAQAPIQAQARSSIMLALLAIVLVTGVAAAVSQIISAPILRLTWVAERVAEGDLDARGQATTEDEIGALTKSFNLMTDELQDSFQNLEQRVAERTTALELSSDVSRRLSTILDPVDLVSEVVELLQKTFNYYHVQIYLLDERKDNLVMVGGTGEAGQVMLERGHSLPSGRGLVGRACETGLEVLVADTVHDPNWVSNPLLPDTRSEIAVPIMTGKDVLGALDVQQNRVDGLGKQDADLLRGIANQVAIALQNANRFTQAQHRSERERMVANIIQQIQKTRSVPDALQVAARELGRTLHAPQTRAGITAGKLSSGPKTTDGNGQNGGHSRSEK